MTWWLAPPPAGLPPRLQQPSYPPIFPVLIGGHFFPKHCALTEEAPSSHCPPLFPSPDVRAVVIVADLSLCPLCLDLAPLCHPLSTATLLSVFPIAPCLTSSLCDGLPQFVIVLNFTSPHLNTIQHLSSPVLFFINKFDFPVIGLIDLALELATQSIGGLILFTNDINCKIWWAQGGCIVVWFPKPWFILLGNQHDGALLMC